MSRILVGTLLLLLFTPWPSAAGDLLPVSFPGSLPAASLETLGIPATSHFFAFRLTSRTPEYLPSEDGRRAYAESVAEADDSRVGNIIGATDGSDTPVISTAGDTPTDTTTPTDDSSTTTNDDGGDDDETISFGDPSSVVSTDSTTSTSTTTGTEDTEVTEVEGAVSDDEATGMADALDRLMKAGATRGHDNAALSILYKELRDGAKRKQLHPATVRQRLEEAGLSGSVLEQILSPLLLTSRDRYDEAFGDPPATDEDDETTSDDEDDDTDEVDETDDATTFAT